MSPRNFNSIQEHITREILIQSSKYLNEFENNVSRAIKLANEIVLNNLLDNANDNIKIDRVYSDVEKITPTHENVLLNLSRMLGDNSSLTNLSTDFLEIFFDKKQDTFSTLIAKETFIKQDSANAIIKMSSILILCYLAKNKVPKNNLVSHFENKPKVETIIEKPKEEAIKIDVSVDNPKKNQTVTNNKATEKKVEKTDFSTTEETTKSSKKPIFIVIGLLAAAAIGYFVVAEGGDKTTTESENITPTEAVSDTETQPQVIEGENITNLGDFIDFTLPSDDIITIPEKGVEKALLDLVLDNAKSLDESSFWLCMDRVYFDAREPNYKVNSEEQLKNLSLILTSFPKVELNIGSYTDNLGNPASNLELSKKRAESIKSGLVKLGIADKRITTEGFGDGFPIAENTTPENQKMNRRISIKLIKK
jgi:OmpA-OmpF porin, OOP family